MRELGRGVCFSNCLRVRACGRACVCLCDFVFAYIPNMCHCQDAYVRSRDIQA